LSGCLCNFLYVKKKFNKEKRVISDLQRGEGSKKKLSSTPLFHSLWLPLFSNSNFEQEYFQTKAIPTFEFFSKNQTIMIM